MHGDNDHDEREERRLERGDLRVLLAVQAALWCDARNAFDTEDEPDSSQVATEP